MTPSKEQRVRRVIPRDVKAEWLTLVSDGVGPYVAATYLGLSKGTVKYLLDPKGTAKRILEWRRKNRDKVAEYNRRARAKAKRLPPPLAKKKR